MARKGNVFLAALVALLLISVAPATATAQVKGLDAGAAPAAAPASDPTCQSVCGPEISDIDRRLTACCEQPANTEEETPKKPAPKFRNTCGEGTEQFKEAGKEVEVGLPGACICDPIHEVKVSFLNGVGGQTVKCIKTVDHSKELKVVHDRITTLIETHEGDVSDLRKRLDQVEKDIVDLKAGRDRIFTELRQIWDKIREIEGRLDAIEPKIEDHEGRISTLEKQGWLTLYGGVGGNLRYFDATLAYAGFVSAMLTGNFHDVVGLAVEGGIGVTGGQTKADAQGHVFGSIGPIFNLTGPEGDHRLYAGLEVRNDFRGIAKSDHDTGQFTGGGVGAKVEYIGCIPGTIVCFAPAVGINSGKKSHQFDTGTETRPGVEFYGAFSVKLRTNLGEKEE
ncbi:hypothetical protein L0Y59_04945 [Candidatus Uhrbacteria bacterium]|nr:hypothetical protein [Candidatus Uhrbacteria bacterium]